MYKIFGAMVVIALLISGCGDEAKASASTEQVESDSVRWNKVIDFMDLNKGEKFFLNDNLGNVLIDNTDLIREYGITFLDIKDFTSPFMEATEKSYRPEMLFSSLWFGIFFEYIQNFHQYDGYKEKNIENFKKFINEYASLSRANKL